MQYTDPAVARKALALRQNLNARLQGSHGMELLNNLLATYACSKFSPQDMSNPPKFQFPPLSPLFSSPGLFHQALASAFQPGALPLPRQFAEDLSVPALAPRTSEVVPPPVPKLPKRMPPSPACFKRKAQSQDFPSQCDRERMDSILYCQPTFYPILKDQVEKTQQSLRTAEQPKFSISSPIQETGVLVPSLIDGEIIMGFNVWGEKRLCLPHLFRFVLNDVDLKAIDEACTKLQITCTTCTPAQLTLLHSRKILPKAVSSCGLIRKSDAERLTKFIRNRIDSLDKYVNSESARDSSLLRLHRSHQADVDVENNDLSVTKPKPIPRSQRDSPIGSDVEATESSGEAQSESTKVDQPEHTSEHRNSPSSQGSSTSTEPIPVIHECFGRQLGFIHAHLYTEPSSKCIECRTCHRLFAPDQFVGHTHTVTEVDNLNHWGFDSNNWRCYLRLYTGRRSRPGSTERSTVQELSDDESNRQDSVASVQVHRRLEEFKIKFAQPIRLPASLSAALRTVGLCASIAPIPPALIDPDAHPVPESTGFQPPFTSPKPTVSKEPFTSMLGIPAQSGPTNTSPVPSVMLPQLTLRRLWAPNDGRIRVPPPPKPLVTRDSDAIPKKLQTGPPLLLHSHRVVSQAAAERYDRDFIPNVCLMPPLKPSTEKPGRRPSSPGSAVENASVVLEDRCKGSRKLSYKLTEKTKPRANSWTPRTRMRSLSHTSDSARSDSVISLYDQQLSAAKKRRSRSLTVPRNKCLDANSSSDSRSAFPASFRRKSTKPSLMRNENLNVDEPIVNQTHSSRSRKPSYANHQYSFDTQWQDRAMAAAKAAQGVASRTCPGLWSRHFTNLNGSNGGPLNLPNAREPPAASDVNSLRSEHHHSQSRAHMSNTPVLVTSPTKNSLPTAVLALEAIWADLVRHINEYTVAVESRTGALEARQRLFEQFITMQTCYATHIATLANENQKLLEKLAALEKQQTPASTPKTPTTPQANQSGFGQEWNRSTTSAKQHVQGYAPSSASASAPQITSQSTSLSIFPHRSRKESTRMFLDHRGAQGTIKTGSSSGRYIGGPEKEVIPPAPPTKEVSLPAALSDANQHRFVASPNYTTSSSDDTNQASTTPTASETDGLIVDNNNSNRYSGEYLRVVESRASERPLHTSPPYTSTCGNSSQPTRASTDGHQSLNPEASSDDIDSRPVDGSVSFSSTIHRRRSLLPPCEERSRMSLKPHSRLLTRS
ncbi:Ski oncogene [Clonorchis sinensis]|uniref:Ski oncogene n=1 Tax=Clonorchis sinensis TaxID=79923 RepID=G7YE50_CLOSI|nr:Ski oncogene [Clonorchis sinensis]